VTVDHLRGELRLFRGKSLSLPPDRRPMDPLRWCEVLTEEHGFAGGIYD
jgi:hypothetical protein